MTVSVAIPIYRVSCKVGIDKGRRWSVIEELLLWSLTAGSKTLGELSSEANLPRQIIVATVSRLMRFRLVEVTLDGLMVKFRASANGKRALTSGEELPYFPKRHYRRVSFVVSKVTGEMFASGGIRARTQDHIDEDRSGGKDIRFVHVKAGGPPLMSHDACRISSVEDQAIS